MSRQTAGCGVWGCADTWVGLGLMFKLIAAGWATAALKARNRQGKCGTAGWLGRCLRFPSDMCSTQDKNKTCKAPDHVVGEGMVLGVRNDPLNGQRVGETRLWLASRWASWMNWGRTEATEGVTEYQGQRLLRERGPAGGLPDPAPRGYGASTPLPDALATAGTSPLCERGMNPHMGCAPALTVARIPHQPRLQFAVPTELSSVFCIPCAPIRPGGVGWVGGLHVMRTCAGGRH